MGTEALEELGILKEDKNCWKLGYADRVSFLIDGDVYFRSLVSAVDQAEKAICGITCATYLDKILSCHRILLRIPVLPP